MPSSPAEAVRSNITHLFREGDQLMMECEVPDDDSEGLLARCPHVSLELGKKLVTRGRPVVRHRPFSP